MCRFLYIISSSHFLVTVLEGFVHFGMFIAGKNIKSFHDRNVICQKQGCIVCQLREFKLLLRFRGTIPFILELFLMFTAIIFAVRMYSGIDKGQPCRNPLCRFIKDLSQPLVLTELETELSITLIHLIKLGPKPNRSRTLKRYPCATRSKAFIWSTEMTASGRLLTLA